MVPRSFIPEHSDSSPGFLSSGTYAGIHGFNRDMEIFGGYNGILWDNMGYVQMISDIVS
jgi:hypothetical protein